MKFEVDDIVYFKEEHFALYTSGYYYFETDKPYKIVVAGGFTYDVDNPMWMNANPNRTCVLMNMTETRRGLISHFIHGDGFDKLIPLEVYRDSKINTILNINL